MPLISKLHVVITADGAQRTFDSEGDGWVVVAAFRSWLTSPDCQLPMAEGADTVDVDDEQVDEPALPPPSVNPVVDVKAELPQQPDPAIWEKPRRFFKTSAISSEPPKPPPPPKPERIAYKLTDRLMAEAFYVGSGKYDFARLTSCAYMSQGGHEYTVQDIKKALIELVLAKKIGARTVGDKQEWWRLPPNSTSLQQGQP